jgi:DNA-binding transcriptional ArsR family regulator
VLRIHFTREDLAGTRVATGVNPMWEMLFSRLRLRERVHGPQLASWAQTVRSDPGAAKVAAGVRVLRVLAPLGPYFPDFLTPPEGTHGLGAGLDALMSTPRRRLRHEMGLLAESSLAHRLGISLPSVSRHTTVLRRAGLVTSLRQGPAVLHTRTELGTAVLRGVRSLPL